MKKIAVFIMLIAITIGMLTGCKDFNLGQLARELVFGKPTLDELLADNPAALKALYDETPYNSVVIECEDYRIYTMGGGICDEIDATRYAYGLKETTDRFVDFQYVVEDNETGWLYIFEDLNDIPIWARYN